MRLNRIFPTIAIAAIFSLAVGWSFSGSNTFIEVTGAAGAGTVDSQGQGDASASAAAFSRAFQVFQNPRCVNCHPIGDAPLQGDDEHVHIMNVQRGPEGIGKNGLWCSTCHQEKNLEGAHMPPGAPGWQLPPADMRMIFQNASARDLCTRMKDPAQNGMRSPDEVVEHVETAQIVLWGWKPGEGRNPVKVPHEEFVKDMKEWVAKGAACPE